MKVISIAAVGKNGVIGNKDALPWNIPEDMKHFRNATMSNVVLMGRKTFDVLGKPLPKRENAVITRNQKFKVEGAKTFSNVKDAINYYRSREKELAGKNIFVIGGAQIYAAAMDLVDEVWLTEIDSDFDGDVFFPDYRDGKFLRNEFFLAKSRQNQDSSSPFSYRFNEFSRRA